MVAVGIEMLGAGTATVLPPLQTTSRAHHIHTQYPATERLRLHTICDSGHGLIT